MKHRKSYVAAGAVALFAGGALLAAPLTFASAAPAKPAASVRPLSSVTGASSAVPPGGHGIAFATCPAGKIVSGGGGTTSAFDIEFTDSTVSGNGWLIRGTNHGRTTQNLTATAVCLGLS